MDKERQPGDGILDRYLPGASDEERAEARANLYAYLEVLLRIATRRAEEDWSRGIRPEGRRGVDLPDGASPSP